MSYIHVLLNVTIIKLYRPTFENIWSIDNFNHCIEIQAWSFVVACLQRFIIQKRTHLPLRNKAVFRILGCFHFYFFLNINPKFFATLYLLCSICYYIRNLTGIFLKCLNKNNNSSPLKTVEIPKWFSVPVPIFLNFTEKIPGLMLMPISTLLEAS